MNAAAWAASPGAAAITATPDGLRQKLLVTRRFLQMKVREYERLLMGGIWAQVEMKFEADEVTLLTLHRAKGLEYGIVICPFTWDGTSLHEEDKRWIPDMEETRRAALFAGWKKAVTRTFDWVE